MFLLGVLEVFRKKLLTNRYFSWELFFEFINLNSMLSDIRFYNYF